MGTRDTYQKTLLKACMVAGDETALAEQLGVPASNVIDCLLGDAPIPTDMFLRAVDIVLVGSRQHVLDTRAFLERIQQRRAQSGSHES
jgi:hypothetical protein